MTTSKSQLVIEMEIDDTILELCLSLLISYIFDLEACLQFQLGFNRSSQSRIKNRIVIVTNDSWRRILALTFFLTQTHSNLKMASDAPTQDPLTSAVSINFKQTERKQERERESLRAYLKRRAEQSNQELNFVQIFCLSPFPLLLISLGKRCWRRK